MCAKKASDIGVKRGQGGGGGGRGLSAVKRPLHVLFYLVCSSTLFTVLQKSFFLSGGGMKDTGVGWWVGCSDLVLFSILPYGGLS